MSAVATTCVTPGALRYKRAQSAKLLLRQTLGRCDHRDTGRDQSHLDRARAWIGAAMETRDETGDGDVEETRGRESERVRQRTLRLTQSKVRHYCAEHGSDAGREIEHERPRARQPRLHEDGEIPDTMRDLVCGHGEGREDAQLHTTQEGGSDERAIERVVEAVAHEHQNP